jgi:hypothetical protein
MKPVRPWKEVLGEWAPEVALKLKRSEAELRERGLSALDFSPFQSVEVRLTGVTHRFTRAFAVIRPQTGEVAVFSEHAGYVEFQLVVDDVVAEIEEDFYRHEGPDD